MNQGEECLLRLIGSKIFCLLLVLICYGTVFGKSSVVIDGKGFTVTLKSYKLLVKTLEPEKQVILKNNRFYRLRFIKHLAEIEAISQIAKKEGFDRLPEVKIRMEFAKKEALARMWLKKKVEKRMKSFKVSDKDIELYYKTHKDEFKDSKGKVLPLKEVKDLIRNKLREEFKKSLVEKIIKNALTKENVKIHPELVN